MCVTVDDIFDRR